MKAKYGLEPIGTHLFSSDGSFNIPVKMRPFRNIKVAQPLIYARNLLVIPSDSDIHNADGRYRSGLIHYEDT